MTADESLADVLARVRRQVEDLAASLPLAVESARREEREACVRLAASFKDFTGFRGDDPDAYGRTDAYGRGHYDARACIADAIRARKGP